MLLPRVITAVIGIPAVVFLVHIGGFPYAAFVFTVITLSLYEYYLLMKLGSKPVQGLTLFAIGLALPAALYIDRFPAPQAGWDNFAGSFITLAVIAALSYEIFSGRKYLERAAFTLLGIFMIPWCMFHLVALRELQPGGKALSFLLIVTVWVMDTAAYAAGRLGGRAKLTSISPKKTWEGAAAGFIAAALAALLWRALAGKPVGVPFALAAGVLIGIFGQLSDIAESMLKRAAGVKDSSNLLPGHGGILDRFDSYIFLAPALYYFAVYSR